MGNSVDSRKKWVMEAKETAGKTYVLTSPLGVKFLETEGTLDGLRGLPRKALLHVCGIDPRKGPSQRVLLPHTHQN